MNQIKYQLIALMLLLAALLNGQTPRVEQLMDNLIKAGQDTSKVHILNSLAEELYLINPYEALSYSLDARELAKKLEYRHGEATALKYIGTAYAYQGNYVESYRYWEEALDIFRKIDDEEGESNILSNLGVLDAYQGQNSRALDRYFEARDIAEKIQDTLRIITVMNNIGLILSEKDDEMALENYFEVLRLSNETGYTRGIATASNNIGEIYFYQGALDTALKYFERSIPAFKEINSLDITDSYIYIGKIYSEKEDFENALKYQEESLSVAIGSGGKRQELVSILALAETYATMGNATLALRLNRKAEKLAEDLGAKQEKMDALRGMSSNYKMLGNFRNALNMMEQAFTLRDTIYAESSEEQLNKLRVQHEIDNILQDKEVLELKNKQQKFIIFAFLFGLLVTTVFIVLLFINIKQKREANKILEDQNILITGQKQEITDSIRYASRIQKAILTPDEEISKLLPDHFILYKPRDIVSGDFYWITEIQNRIMCVVADCTGHGVPGAFMSMLGVAFLNEIISRKPDIPANEMLNELRTHVIESLHQKSIFSRTTDGMDLSAFIIEKERNTIQYAGANNPLLLIRDKELIEYKPDKMPIGIHENSRKSFTNHEFEYRKGDVIYAFSDGYPDQFGGPKGKKFLIKNLKEQILSIHKKKMAEQRKILDETLEAWKSGVSQVDDILVMGVRL